MDAASITSSSIKKTVSMALSEDSGMGVIGFAEWT